MFNDEDFLFDFNNFIFKNMIDTDTLGESYEVMNKSTKEIFLAKKMNKNISQKIKHLPILNSPSILKFIGYSPIENEQNLDKILFFEFPLPITLNDIIHLDKFSQFHTFKLIIIYGIASATSYLHSHDIIHEALQPKNVLFSKFFLPKLSPFFMSNKDDNSDLNSSNYKAPETIEKSELTKCSNVYSFSIIVYEILTGKKFNFDELNLTEIQPFFKDLIENCLSEDPQKRPTFDEILEQLKNNSEINENDFYDYVNYIENCEDDKNIKKFINLKSKTYKGLKDIIGIFKDRNKIIDLSRFRIIRSIGSGTFGSVYLVKEKRTNKKYAAKVLKEKISSDYKKDEKTLLFYREVKLMSILNHPSIIKFYGYSSVDFKDALHPTIVSEYAQNGTLKSILDLERLSLAPKCWNETRKLILIYGIASGMSYLHSHNVIHRDLKPENILIDEFLLPKISDFGLSKIIISSNESNISPTLQFVSSNCDLKGSPLYMPPETIDEHLYSKAGDVFAFSIIAYEILTLIKPFENISIDELFINVVFFKKRPELTDDIPYLFRELLQRCWSMNPNDRPTFNDIVDELKNNPDYITQNIDENEFYEYIDFIDNAHSSFDINKSVQASDLAHENSVRRLLKKINIHAKLSFSETDDIEGDDEEETDDENQTEEEEEFNDDNLIEEEEFNDDQNKFNSVSIGDEIKEEDRKIGKEKKNRKVGNAVENEDSLKDENNLMQKVIEIESDDTDRKGQEDNIHEMDLPQGISANDAKSLYLKGKDLIEGTSDIQKDIEKGIRYLKESISLNYTKSLLYYCELLIDGKIIPRDLEKAKMYLTERLKEKNSNIKLLYGKILLHEKNFSEAKIYIKKSVRKGNAKAIYEYGKMLYLGNGCTQNTYRAIKYFQLSKKRGHDKSNKFLLAYDQISKVKVFRSLNAEIQYFFIKHIMKNIDANKFKIWDKITIKPKILEIMFLNNLFNSKRLKSLLSQFEYVSVEMIYQPEIADAIKSSIFNFSKYKTFVTIPSSKSSIKPKAFFGLSSLKMIDIPSTITSFGDFAFYECSSLSQITIPPSVTSIGKGSFYGCSLLTQISIPTSVSVIKDMTFYRCKSLKTIDIPSSITSFGDLAFYECSSLSQIVIPPSVTSIGRGAFEKCFLLKQLAIPSSIKLIQESTFSECSSLKQISIPSSLDKIEEYAFYSCWSLKEISIPPSVRWIGENAFEGCSSLTQISIPSSIKLIEKCLFSKCRSLTQIDILSPVSLIANGAFSECSSLVKITIPSSVTVIGKKSFAECSSLKEIIIPSSVTSIETWAFFNCSSLEEISIPSSVTSIGRSAFEKCSSLAQISIPSSIKFIVIDTFCYCTKLKQITFETPSSVSSIGENAFYECASLVQIQIPSSVTYIEQSAFNECSSLKQVEFEYPSSVVSIGHCAFGNCSALTRIALPSSVTSIGKVVFRNCSLLKEVILPPSIVSLGDNAFEKCSSLTQVIIPSSVNSLGDHSFYKCSLLEKVTFSIPSKVKKIETYSFYKCSSLTEIILPPSVTSIENYSFYGCSKLKQITIPPSVTSIGNYAFYKCSSLKQITIPPSVISIGNYAFYECSSLKQITIPPSVISIGNSAFYKCSSLIQVEITSNIYAIEDYSFYQCSSLTQIILPSSINIIGNYAFSGCSSLVQIIFPSSLRSIKSYAFYNCASITQLSIPPLLTNIEEGTFHGCSSLIQVTIPPSVTSIGENSFKGCKSLKQITIPPSVTSIGYHAFQYCRSLSQVEITSPSISIQHNAFDHCYFLNKNGKMEEKIKKHGNGKKSNALLYCLLILLVLIFAIKRK